MNTKIRILFLALACSFSIVPSVQAADSGVQGRSKQSVAIPQKSKTMARPATADKDYTHEKLTGFVDLPDVPKYSGAGAVFLSGSKYPNDTFGQNVAMTFGVLEQAAQVNDWYKAALQQYQWTVYPVKATTLPRTEMYSIDAGKGKYNVSVIIRSVAAQTYRTQVEIRFKYGK